MKLSLVLSLVAGLATALETNGPEGRYRKRGLAVKKVTGEFLPRAASKPANAPAGYETFVSLATEKRSTAGLAPVPADVERRRESVLALRRLRRQVKASDFYECYDANPPPSSADCGVIVQSVGSTGTDLVVVQNSCLVFAFGTCQGFFCSLCETLSTSTEFISSQLDLVDALCVSDGKTGAIVGEEPPQYSVGFVRSGSPLPSFDTC